MIRAGLPVFEPGPDAVKVGPGAVQERARVSPYAAPAPGVVRMSPYVTREKKALTDESVLSETGLSLEVMDRYLGSADSFDRGYLNVVTLPELWKKIPILGSITDFAGVTNEERAMRQYRVDRRADILREFADFVSLSSLEGAGPGK